ncbi:MAG: DUF2218 domain-containing protein [Pseudomonadota bacterium]
MQAFATLKTEQASQYLRALCDHFGPQACIAKQPSRVLIALSFGRCQLAQRDGALALCAEAKDQAQLDWVVEVMTRYVERVAFRENPHLNWRAGHDSPTQDAPTEFNPHAQPKARPQTEPQK